MQDQHGGFEKSARRKNAVLPFCSTAFEERVRGVFFSFAENGDATCIGGAGTRIGFCRYDRGPETRDHETPATGWLGFSAKYQARMGN